MVEKPLFWLGSSRADIRAFPARARRVAGFQLLRLLHAFEKRASKTAKRDLEVARERYRDLVKRRKGRSHAQA